MSATAEGRYQTGMMDNELKDKLVAKPAEMVVIEAVIQRPDGPNDPISLYSLAYYERIAAEMEFRGGGAKVSLDYDTFEKYVWTLIVSRVAHCRKGETTGFTRVVDPRDDRILVPVFLAEVLENIGRVEYQSAGVMVIPTLARKPSSAELLTLEECHEVSRSLERLTRMGFVFARGYRRDPRGDVGFMSLQCIEGMVRSHTDVAAPIKAVFAWFLNMTWVTALLGARVEYCSAEAAKEYMLDLVARY